MHCVSYKISSIQSYLTCLLFLVTAMIVHLMVLSQRTNLLMDALENDAIPCTYSELHEAFGVSNQKTFDFDYNATKSKSNSNECWSLSNSILRVHTSHIVNRRHLKFFGHGYKGGVAKGLIQTKRHASPCAVAIKTDLCRLPWSDVREKDRESCVTPGAFYWRGQSYLGSEYMGILPFQTLYNAGIDASVDMKGMIPTWGVIEGYAWSTIPRSRWYGRVHPDPRVLGTIMPLRHFKTLNDVDETLLISYVPNVTTAAKILLPAAEALSYVSSLALGYQDINKKNAGLVFPVSSKESIPYAILYDNSFMGFHKSTSCTADKHVNGACDFCPEDVFLGSRKHNGTGNPIKDDRGEFKKVVWYFLKNIQSDEETRKRDELARNINHSESMDDIVELLRNASYANNATY